MNISGINSNLFNTDSTVLNSQARTITENADAQKSSKAEEEANGGVSKDGDTVTISAAGTYLQKTFQASSQSTLDYLKEDTTEGLDSTAKAIASAASAAGISTAATAQSQAGNAASTVSASGSDSTTDLSQYTTSELKEMLQNGEITRQEYNEEMESRQHTQTDTDDEETDTSSQQTGSGIAAVFTDDEA